MFVVVKFLYIIIILNFTSHAYFSQSHSDNLKYMLDVTSMFFMFGLWL